MQTYPHIVSTEGTCGARPRIDGTRIEVATIAAYMKQGVSIEELANYYPSLKPAEILSAAAYYHDNHAEIEAILQEQRRLYDEGRAAQQQQRRLPEGVTA